MMTVKQFLSRTVACAALACQSAHGGIDAELFPSLSDYGEEAIRLHGLAKVFPGRVVFEDPKLITSAESRVATRVEDLPRAIKYIRLYRLDEAEAVLTEFQAHPALILDFRFLKSEHAAVETFACLAPEQWIDGLTTVGTVPNGLIKASEDATAPRNTPAIVLCNRETAGPFEAILHKLQESGAIIAVGESTAGRTGFYEQAEHGAWILSGEIRPDSDTSLVGVGFQPRIQLELDAEESYLSYHLYEAGTTMTQLLRKENATDKESHQATEGDSALIEPDRILQRGVDIIAALKILQQQPEL